MRKFLKWLIGVALLPVCYAASRTLWELLLVAQPKDVFLLPPSAWWMVGGFSLWLLLFMLFPKPVRAYIAAHELTHALWGLVMGASVRKLSVRKDRGAVSLSKTNFLITLAPYFFPFYTMIVIGGYTLLGFFYPVIRFAWLWHAMVGFTWSFHVTFTISALLQRQSDIRDHGRLFSYTVIYLANLLCISAWLVYVSEATLGDALELAALHATSVWDLLADGMEQAARAAKAIRQGAGPR